MKTKAIAAIMVTMLMLSMLTLASNVQPVEAESTSSQSNPSIWDVCYSADELPNETDPVWELWRSFVDDSGVATVADGILTLDTTSEDQYWYYQRTTTFDNSNGSTVEARLKVESADPLYWGQISIVICDGTKVEILCLREDRIATWHSGLHWDMITTDKYHTYRIVAKGSDFWVFVDGRLRINGTGEYTTTISDNLVAFGDIESTSGEQGAKAHWDYVCYTAQEVYYLRIGIIGPVGWPQGLGMEEGAELAKNWVNGPGGGVVIEGTRYDVQLFFGWDHAEDVRPDLGALEMERLVGDGAGQEDVDLVIGGIRTECVMAMREVAMDYDKLFFICGAAANELVDCGGGDDTCGACVRCDYNRYKYLFRVAPVNVTTLILNIKGFLKDYVIPQRMVPLYGDPIKTAVIVEDLDWTVGFYQAFTILTSEYLGTSADVVYSARTPYPTTDFSSYLDAMHAAEVRLVIHIYSAGDTMTLVRQMAVHPLKAVLVGIDVIGQCSEFKDWTDGQIEGCDYETFLATSGTRTPVSNLSQPYNTTDFWDLYYAAYGHAPISTSFGAYEAIIAMHDMLEAGTIHPPFDTADADALVPIIEATDRQSTLGRFKYTQYHDPISTEYGVTWTQGYVRPLVVQWQAGRLEVVWPKDQPYSKYWVLPRKMYPYPRDVDQDGDVLMADISAVCYAYESYPAAPDEPAHPRWQFAADVRRDNFIDAWDLVEVSWDYGTTYTLPIPY